MAKVTTPTACIQAEKDDVAKVVLMPGDPLRAKYIAETYLENPVLFNTVRNMFGYTGTYKGKKISVMGSGMGVPSMSLYATDLYNFFDVEAIIRIGSAGGLPDEVKLRDVVIAMSASTNSAYGERYGFKGTLAPTANFEMLSYAVEAAKEKGTSIKVGSVFTTDSFYADKSVNENARELNLLCAEMETAGLYWTATALHKKALSMLTISDHIFTGEELSVMERQESFNEMMEIALETAWKTIK